MPNNLPWDCLPTTFTHHSEEFDFQNQFILWLYLSRLGYSHVELVLYVILLSLHWKLPYFDIPYIAALASPAQILGFKLSQRAPITEATRHYLLNAKLSSATKFLVAAPIGFLRSCALVTCPHKVLISKYPMKIRLF